MEPNKTEQKVEDKNSIRISNTNTTGNSNNSDNSNEGNKKFLLTEHYYLLEYSGFIAPILVGLAILFFPDYFQWVILGVRGENAGTTIVISLFVYALIDAIMLILHELTHKNFFFNLNRYMFVLFFAMIIALTGGVNSSFIFLVIVPLIASVVYLDDKTTRNIGFFQTFVFSLLIFTHPLLQIDGNLIAKHIVQTGLISIISLLMYRIVVTILRQKYEKEENARRLLEMVRVDRLKEDFLSVAEHRLRTPLSGVRWALESLESEPNMSESASSIIKDSLERVNDSIKIVNEMLKTVEDASGGAVQMIYKNIDLVALIKDVSKDLSFVAMKKNNLVSMNLPPKLEIQVDEDKLNSAFTNLVDNSFKYTKNGKVELVLTSDSKNAIFTISDNGMGIDPDDMPYIFDRFHRGKNALLVDPDESGIGLYISKKIIELHGGTIGIESKLNTGTKITVILPLIPAK